MESSFFLIFILILAIAALNIDMYLSNEKIKKNILLIKKEINQQKQIQKFVNDQIEKNNQAIHKYSLKEKEQL